MDWINLLLLHMIDFVCNRVIDFPFKKYAALEKFPYLFNWPYYLKGNSNQDKN